MPDTGLSNLKCVVKNVLFNIHNRSSYSTEFDKLHLYYTYSHLNIVHVFRQFLDLIASRPFIVR
jgi:hypothetical protein